MSAGARRNRTRRHDPAPSRGQAEGGAASGFWHIATAWPYWSGPMPILPEQARVADLCRRFNVRWLDLFGSAETGHFDAGHSDLDLLVEFAPMPPGAYAASYFGLREALEAACGRP